MKEPLNPGYFQIALAVASMSRDQRKKVGAIAIDDAGTIRSTGYNGFPRRVDETPEHRHCKPDKLLYTCHAEENLISQAARVGSSLLGCTVLVTTLFPCATCARMLIQAGIVRVIAPTPCESWSPKWFQEAQVSRQMFEEAGVIIEYLDYPLQEAHYGPPYK